MFDLLANGKPAPKGTAKMNQLTARCTNANPAAYGQPHPRQSMTEGRDLETMVPPGCMQTPQAQIGRPHPRQSMTERRERPTRLHLVPTRDTMPRKTHVM